MAWARYFCRMCHQSSPELTQPKNAASMGADGPMDSENGLEILVSDGPHPDPTSFVKYVRRHTEEHATTSTHKSETQATNAKRMP